MTSSDNQRAAAEQLIAQGRAALLAGDQAGADRLLDQATALYRQIDDNYAIAAQTGNYGWALRRAGQPERAAPYLHRAADLFTALGMADFAERHRNAADAGDATPLTAEILASLPPAVRGALERGDGPGLEFALNALPLAEQQVVFDQLVAAGVISDPAAAEADEMRRQFAPLLDAIADVARGNAADRAEIEAALRDIERKGWFFGRAIPAIWAGERDPAVLTRGLDHADTLLVQRILELLAAPPPA